MRITVITPFESFAQKRYFTLPFPPEAFAEISITSPTLPVLLGVSTVKRVTLSAFVAGSVVGSSEVGSLVGSSEVGSVVGLSVGS